MFLLMLFINVLYFFLYRGNNKELIVLLSWQDNNINCKSIAWKSTEGCRTDFNWSDIFYFNFIWYKIPTLLQFQLLFLLASHSSISILQQLNYHCKSSYSLSQNDWINSWIIFTSNSQYFEDKTIYQNIFEC